MAQVIWTEPALSELEAIAEYIALDKPTAASQLVRKIFSSTNRLEQFPKSGSKPPELKESQYRELIVNPCRVFYRIDGDRVFIVYVMRGERELRRYLFEEWGCG